MPKLDKLDFAAILELAVVAATITLIVETLLVTAGKLEEEE